MLKKKLTKNIRNIILLLLVGFVVWFFFIKPKNLTSQVRKVQLQNKVVVKNVSSSGTVVSKNQADLGFTSGGKLVAIYVKKNDVVKRGQTLAVVDASSSIQTGASLRDARDIAQHELAYFVMKKTDNEKLYGQKGYELKLKEMQERLSQANNSYNAQRTSVTTSAYIVSPIAGTIVDVTKDVGENAGMGEIIVKVADLENLKFDVELDQEDYGRVKLGQAVNVKLNSYDKYDYKGVVSDLPLIAQPDTKNFKISIELRQETAHAIRLGMEGDAYIILETSEKEVPALTIDDIFYDQDNKPFVWLVKSNKLVKLGIVTGIEGDIYTEVKTPFADTIVVPAKTDDKLTEGYTAQIIN